MSFNSIIQGLDITLAYYDGKPDLKELQEFLSKDGLEVRQPHEHDLMFDVDFGDYIITIHYYNAPSDLPKNAIQLGKTYYMYPSVEVLAPNYIGMCDVVLTVGEDYKSRYGVKFDDVVYL